MLQDFCHLSPDIFHESLMTRYQNPVGLQYMDLANLEDMQSIFTIVEEIRKRKLIIFSVWTLFLLNCYLCIFLR